MHTHVNTPGKQQVMSLFAVFILLSATIILSGCIQFWECEGTPDAPNAGAYVLPDPGHAFVDGSDQLGAMSARYVPPQDEVPPFVRLTGSSDVSISIASHAFSAFEAGTLLVGDHIAATFNYSRPEFDGSMRGLGHLRITHVDEDGMAATFAACVQALHGAPPITFPSPSSLLQGAFHVER